MNTHTQSPLDFHDAIGPTEIQATQRYRLTSEIADETYLIDVAPPVIPPAPGQALPVLIVLDGDRFFPVAAHTARAQQMEPGGLPPMLVVGIGYEGDLFHANNARIRDLTFSRDDGFMAMMKAAPAPFTLPAGFEPGNAPQFLSFIRGELIPFLEMRYSIDLEDLSLAGASLGGTFALQILFNEPGLFRRYAAISPALWWDGLRVFQDEERYAARHDDLPARLFLSVGSREEGQDENARMVSNLERFCEVLGVRHYKQLSVEHHVAMGESHMSAPAASIGRALRWLYGTNDYSADWAKF